MRHVNALTVARACNLTPQRVHQLIGEGMPKVVRGQFELVPCLSWYIRYLQTLLEQRSGDGTGAGTLAVERAGLAREQRLRLAYQNAVSAGELARVDDIAKELALAVGNVVTRLGQIASTVANNFDTNTAPRVRSAVQAAINTAITDLRKQSIAQMRKGKRGNGEHDDATRS